MKIIASELHSAVSACRPFVAKGSVPILKCIRIVAKSGAVELVATDTAQTIIARAACDGDAAFCIDADALEQKTRLLKPGPVEIAVTDREATIVQGRSRWKMPILPADDFPGQVADPVAGDPVTLPKGFLADLAALAPLAETNPSRPGLMGVHFDGASIVATNGKQLGMTEIGGDFSPITVPTVAVSRLAALDGDISFVATKSSAMFSTTDMSIKTQLVVETYSDWRSVLKHHSAGVEGYFIIERDEFIAALDAASAIRAMGEKSGTFINMQISIEGGQISILTRNVVENEEGHADAPCEQDGPNRKVGFSGAMIAVAAKSLTCKKLRIRYGSSATPFIVSDADGNEDATLRLVMPRMFT